jgi:hypothetical protein
MVLIDAAGGWSLGFMHPSWQLDDGESIPIGLTFDNRAQFSVFGTAVKLGPGPKANAVFVPMPVNSQLIYAFRKGYTLNAYAKGQLYGFNLTTTSQLLPALAACVKANVTQTATGPSNSEGTAGSLNPGPSSDISPELQLEAVQLATNFVLKSGLQNPRVLTRNETPAEFASFGAAWTSDEAIGAVKIVPSDPNTKGLDVAAAVAGADAKECKGKFASGRVSELVDSEVIFRGFSSCEDTDGARSAEFFVVPRKQGGFVIFSVAASNQNQATMPNGASHKITDEDSLAGLQKAALYASQ